MFASKARVRPCSALFCFSSSGRVTTSSFFSASILTVIAGWTLSSSLPLGPSTLTLWSFTVIFAAPTGTGFLPILLMTEHHARASNATPLNELTDGAEQFAADVVLTRLAIGHHAFARADDRDAHA